MEHVLIIGGSGLLREVSKDFAEQGKVVSVVARDKAKIVEMVAETQKAPGLINPIAIDYTDVPALQAKLVEAAAHLGPPVITVAWVNPEAFMARQSIAGFLNDRASGSRMYDLLCGQSGSAGLLSAHSFKIMYHRIIIGSISETDDSRRPNKEEIRNGIFNAISQNKQEFVIGAT
jgi:NAD(P)-dependent dehydrogenase (short-subunit alcohol dehydrogenase family)